MFSDWGEVGKWGDQHDESALLPSPLFDKLDAMIGRVVGRFALGTVLGAWSVSATDGADSLKRQTYEDR